VRASRESPTPAPSFRLEIIARNPARKSEVIPQISDNSGNRNLPDRRPGAEPAGVLEEDAHLDATRDGTGEADRSEGLSGRPADGRILPDAHGPALDRADRDASCVGGKERRRVVEAQEEAQEEHGVDRQSGEVSIILSDRLSVGFVPTTRLCLQIQFHLVSPARTRGSGATSLAEERRGLPARSTQRYRYPGLSSHR